MVLSSKKTIRYKHTRDIHNLAAAQEIVPYIISIINPQSVIDIGCGLGSWLHIFQENGIRDVLGIDGENIDEELLYIDKKLILVKNLEKPFYIGKKFDLALSLEVAEHLSETSAEQFITCLTSLSDIIVFSAAIPGQIGNQNHINEQWPSYWFEKFANHGYTYADIFRERYWENAKVEWWYKQNMFLVFKSNLKLNVNTKAEILSYIHPDLFSSVISKINNYSNGNISIVEAISVLLKTILRKSRILAIYHFLKEN